MDNTNYVAVDHAALINGAWMLINTMDFKYNNIRLIMERNINQALNMKVLTEWDSNYANSTGKVMLFYPDMNMSAANTNAGHESRFNLLGTSGEVRVQIPLRLWGFFESCHENLLPNARMSFSFTIESDNILIHRTGANAGKVILQDLEIHMPKIELLILGREMFSCTFMTNRMWKYMKENVYQISNLTTSPAYFRISESVNLPRYL